MHPECFTSDLWYGNRTHPLLRGTQPVLLLFLFSHFADSDASRNVLVDAPRPRYAAHRREFGLARWGIGSCIRAGECVISEETTGLHGRQHGLR